MVLLVLKLVHYTLTHVSNVFAMLERNPVLLVQVLAMASHLLEEDLAGLLVDIVECLLLVVTVSLGQGHLGLDSICCVPAHRHFI